MKEQEHKDYKKWISELRFYQDELKIFKNKLDLLIEKHPDLMSIIEHVNEYKEIFERKEQKISILLDQIQTKKQVFASDASENGALVWDYDRIKSKQIKFTRKIELLKKNFKRFVSRNMH